jgi:uncharacterized membrane protein SpoIIM required for sporulation
MDFRREYNRSKWEVMMREIMQIFLIAAAGTGVALLLGSLYWLLNKYLLNNTAAYFRKYGEQHGMDFEVEHAGMPPFKLWVHNAKTDKWAKLRMADGSTKWGRLRYSLLNAEPEVTFFDP